MLLVSGELPFAIVKMSIAITWVWIRVLRDRKEDSTIVKCVLSMNRDRVGLGSRSRWSINELTHFTNRYARLWGRDHEE